MSLDVYYYGPFRFPTITDVMHPVTPVNSHLLVNRVVLRRDRDGPNVEDPRCSIMSSINHRSTTIASRDGLLYKETPYLSTI